MVQWVYCNCNEANASNTPASPKFDVFVVTDDARIEEHVHAFGGKALRVDDNVPSGTERIHLAWKRHAHDETGNPYDLVINVQGDEPLLKGEDLAHLADFHLNSDFDITTIVKKSVDWIEFNDPHNVKTIYSRESGRCHYFSRAPIPFDRDGNRHEWFLHIGVYSFRPGALEGFCQAPHSYYEKTECLEQLRALEAGFTIGAVETERTLMGVDVPEDIDKLIGVLGE